MAYIIGMDYGTNSVRCLVVNAQNGREIGTAVFEYPSGQAGILLDKTDHNVARQNPADYLKGLEVTIRGATEQAKKTDKAFSPDQVVGIGVDTTGSTPIPVDAEGVPLAMKPAFRKNLNACVWLWKDHTSYAEAAKITELAAKSGRIFWPSAAAAIPRNGFSARSGIVLISTKRSLMPPIRG